MKYIDTRDMQKCISGLLVYLDVNIRTIGNEVGWHQHIGSRKVGIVASAIGLLLHNKLDKPFAKQQKVLNTLVRKQNSDGGWPYISNSQNCSNVEATCWALLALHAYGKNGVYDNEIGKGVNWLLDQNPSAKEDYGWPFRRNGEIRVYITCFVLRTLIFLGVSNHSKVEAALHWLIEAQSGKGGWGETKGDEPSVFFSAYSLITLLEFNANQSYQSVIDKGEKWLVKTMNTLSMQESFLTCRLEMIETETRNNKYRISFFHYVLPYVLLCYEKLGIHDRVYFSAINLLLERSKDGYINHPMLDNAKKRPIWALYDVASIFDVIALQNNKNKLLLLAFNHMFTIPSCWLTRVLMKFAKKWFFSIVLITAIVYFLGSYIIKYCEMFYKYLIEMTSPNWATFCMSIITSIIATCIVEFVLYIRRKMSVN